jgi:adenine-specific DNA-methyltransferase
MTNKINTTSKDIFLTELEKFKQIFPQFVQENQINFDALKEFLDKNELKKDKEDSYTFSWAGKKEAFKAIQRPSNATLNPNKNESVDFDNTDNVFIEGDNLEVLKLLQQQYFNKIKMIYIDPPYNTGKDFIYKDNFTENKNDYFERIGATKDGITLETNADSNGRFHSHWLSMMYPRLFLAKQLLTDDGVIFISIDDNEQHHLKMLCNEVFGEENFIGNFIVKSAPAGTQSSKNISIQHSYCLAYSKNLEQIKFILQRTKEELNLRYKDKDADGRYYSERLWKRGIGGKKEDVPSLHFPVFYNPKTNEILIDTECADQSNFIKIIPYQTPGVLGRWTWSKEKMINNRKNLIVKKVSNEWKLHKKVYENEEMGKLPFSIINSDIARTELGSIEVKNIFENNKYFEYPKPIKFLIYLINISTKPNDIILDFFAGSATTGHAVMELNKEDKGNRKFILVQIPEATDEKSEAFKAGYKNIAQISKERLRRAITQNEYKEGFKVFELSPSNYNTPESYNGDDENEVLKNEHYILDNPLIENYTVENLIYEIILKQGLSLHSTITLQDDFYIAYDAEREQKLYLTLTSKIIDENIDNLNLTPDDILVCFDTALNDTQKVNLNRNVNLLVI